MSVGVCMVGRSTQPTYPSPIREINWCMDWVKMASNPLESSLCYHPCTCQQGRAQNLGVGYSKFQIVLFFWQLNVQNSSAYLSTGNTNCSYFQIVRCIDNSVLNDQHIKVGIYEINKWYNSKTNGIDKNAYRTYRLQYKQLSFRNWYASLQQPFLHLQKQNHHLHLRT